MSTSSEINFLYLSEEDMIKAGVKNMPACIDTMEEVLKCLATDDFRMAGENHYSHGAMIAFPKESVHPNMPTDKGEDRRFMAMPAYIGGKFDLAGVKWYGSNVSNKSKGLPRSILMVMINDKDTGAPLALMSGNLISSYRTGAIPGVGLRYLARKDAETAGIHGPGVMGRTALDAVMSECPNVKTVKIKGRGQKSIDSFINYASDNYPDIKVLVVDTIEELVRNSDIIMFTATSGKDVSTYEMVKGEWVKPGALLIGVSAFNIEDDFLAGSCKLVVDAMGLYDAWAEEYPYPTFGKINIIGSKFTDMEHDNKIKRSDIHDLGKVVLGKDTVRTSDDDIIVYSVGGMPVEDVAWGKVCYENAKKMGIGVNLPLWTVPDMA